MKYFFKPAFMFRTNSLINIELKKILIALILFASISCFGQVSHIKTYHENEGGIEGLKYPADIEIDRDGNIYIVGNSTITFLKSNDSLKSIEYIEKYDANEFSGLLNTNQIISTPNKRFFYISGSKEMFSFEKNSSTGELIFKQNINEDNSSAAIGYSLGSDMVITPDSKNLYFVSGFSPHDAINIFTINATTGILTLDSKITSVHDLSNLVCNNNFVYASGFGFRDTSLCVFKRSNYNSLTLVQRLYVNSDSIKTPSKLVLSRDNKFLYVYDNKTIVTFDLDENTGKLKYKQTLKIEECFDDFWGLIDMQISDDNKNLYLSGIHSLAVFSRDVSNGVLEFEQVIQQNVNGFEGFDHISSMKIDIKSSKLIALSKYEDQFFIFQRDEQDGKLTYIDKVKNEQGKIKGLSDAVDILISKDDNFLYVLCLSGTNNIAIFERKSNGFLKFKKNVTWDELGPSVGTPGVFKLSSDEKYMFISSKGYFGIRVLRRDTLNGDLNYLYSYTDDETGIEDESITDIVITNDSKNLYAVTYSYLLNYEIDPLTNALNFVSKIELNESGENGFKGNKTILASLDNNYIYTFCATDFYNSGISAYSRNEEGGLSLIDNYTSEDFPFKVRQRFSSLVTPQNDFIYLAGTSLICLQRNKETGELVYVEETKFEEIGLEDLFKIDHIAISNDGKYLVGVSNDDKMIISFYRNIETGKLLLKQIEHFSDDKVYAGTPPKSVFSQDMKNLYIISPYDWEMTAYEAFMPLGLKKVTDVCGDSVNLLIDPGYSYNWSNGDTTSSTLVTEPGIYSVSVQDSSGRKGRDTTEVVFHSIPEVKLYIDTAYSTSSRLFVFSEIEGGAYPYNYLWHDSSTYYYCSVETNVLTTENDIRLKVTDKYGCEANCKFSLELISGLNYLNNNLSIYPNPVQNIINLEFKEFVNDIVLLKIIHSSGKIVYEEKLGGFGKYSVDLSNLSQGMYLLELSNNNFPKILVKVIKN